jgi:ABC-2 type transport system permease protein
MNKENKLFSKALFKQSCKANGVMWTIITFAVCFMLACVMLISGTSSISSMKENVEDTIVQEAINANVKKNEISEYEKSVNGEELFDVEFTTKFKELNTLDTYQTQYVTTLTSLISDYVQSDAIKEKMTTEISDKVTEYLTSTEGKTKIAQYMTQDGLTQEQAIAKLKAEKVAEYTTEVTNEYIASAKNDTSLQSQAFVSVYVTPCYTYAINKVIDVYTSSSSAIVTINPNNQADSIYNQYKETIPEEYVTNLTSYMMSDVISVASGNTTDTLSEYINSDERTTFRQERAYDATSMIIAGKMMEEDTINTLLDTLKDYGVTKEKYDAMGFTYDSVHKIAYEAAMDYQDKLSYEVSLLDSDLSDEEYEEKVSKIKEDLNLDISGSLLDKLPEDVSSGIEELGKMDMYGLIVGSIFFKMAGLLLPIIYLIMASNNLIAGQVDSGSMAYVLSTHTKRRQVTFTQGLFLALSLFLMFVCTSVTSVVCFSLVTVNTDLTIGKLLLINLGAFVVLFAMSGINFFTSCFFDRSKKAMAIGGGLSMFFLVATMLGLFGSPVIPSVVRISALNNFNYVSIISLFDVVSMLNGTTDWIWKLAILVVIGLAGYIIGSIKFRKKDLPL